MGALAHAVRTLGTLFPERKTTEHRPNAAEWPPTRWDGHDNAQKARRIMAWCGPHTERAAVPGEPPPDQGTAAPYPQAPQPDQGAIARPGTEQPSTTPGMPGSDGDEQDVE